MAITKDSASAHPSTPTLEGIAEQVEAEFVRLRVARPALASRIDRAENLLVSHLSCRRTRMVRVRVSSATDNKARFLVQGSGGAVYVVDPASWQCSCPDAHRRSKGCKHSILCWALWRASCRPAPLLCDEEDLLGEDLEFEASSKEASSKKSASCEGCGRTFSHSELIEVTEYHESLTFFPGDRLCVGECAGAHGIL
jgi:hypothetical protein